MIARDPTARRRSCGPSFVRRPALAAALFAAAAWLAPSIASAQGAYFEARAFYDEPDILIPPRAVVHRLQDRGFTEIARPRFDGTAYIVDATAPSGGRMRLFVDARDGAIVGRRGLDTAYFPSARPARSAPGYGWTEDETPFGRTPRGLVPPADIPDAGPSAPRGEAAPGALRSGIDGGPFGVNPDARARPAVPTRKAAKLAPPARQTVPAASVPRGGKAEPPMRDDATDTAGLDAAKPDLGAAEPVTPAANQPATAEKPAAPASGGTAPVPGPSAAPVIAPAAAEARVDGAKRDQPWQEPPADEAKRKVRVIGGATVVPGAGAN